MNERIVGVASDDVRLAHGAAEFDSLTKELVVVVIVVV